MASPGADDREVLKQLRAERDRLARHLDEAQAAVRRQQETIDRLVAQQENWQVLLRDAQTELRAFRAPAQSGRPGALPEVLSREPGEPFVEAGGAQRGESPATVEQRAAASDIDGGESGGTPEPAIEPAAGVHTEAVVLGPEDGPVAAKSEEVAGAAAAPAERGEAVGSQAADGVRGEAAVTTAASGEALPPTEPGLAAWGPGGRRARRGRQRRPRR
ncbi:MAG: hypothetical protein IT304_02755 [Dehalococcoidia bacterium]|nr:hypothetical protein [Dehalococcoidia bacterium]